MSSCHTPAPTQMYSDTDYANLYLVSPPIPALGGCYFIKGEIWVPEEPSGMLKLASSPFFFFFPFNLLSYFSYPITVVTLRADQMRNMF